MTGESELRRRGREEQQAGAAGGELFDDFFAKYEVKLSLDVGPTARQAVTERSTVQELDRFCRNAVRC